MATPHHERQLDLVSLKVLAHPLRIQLLDTLSQYGPMTASGLAERLGESSGATSYHLRQLSKHDFVREVEGKGTVRERWWERVPGGISLDSRHLDNSVAARTASDLVTRQWQRNRESLVMDYLTQAEDTLSAEWLDASQISSSNVRMTVEQLTEFTRDMYAAIDAVIAAYRTQEVPGSRPVHIQFNAFPIIDGEETPS